MAKKYMGEGDPVLDALYEELNATGRKNRADRRKRRQLERQIRELRRARIRGGLGGLFENLVDVLGTVNIADTTGMAQPLTDDQINAYISGKEETGKGDILEQLGYGKVGDVLRRPRADRFPRIKERWEEGFPRLRDIGKNIYDTMAMVNIADTTGMAQPLTEDQIITASENGVQDVL